MAKNSRPSSKNIRRLLLQLFRAGLRFADPGVATQQFLKQSSQRLGEEVRVIAIGKAALTMARASDRQLGRRIKEGLIIIPPTKTELPARTSLKRFRMITSDHPLPTRRSLTAGKALQEFVRRDRSTPLLFLVSGGASSLAVVPKKGVSFNEKKLRVQKLLLNGATIHEVNRARKKMSAIKGGKLLHGLNQPIFSLIASDIVGDPLPLIASGLTVPSSSRKNIFNQIIVPCSRVAEGIAIEAKRLGFRMKIFATPLTGEASFQGDRFAKKLKRLRNIQIAVSYGETTVNVRGKGIGGRNLEFALGATAALQNSGITLASLATDGTDGTSKAAGAFVDGTTQVRAQSLKMKPKRYLARNDSDRFFRRLGDAIEIGPTGSNNADVQIAWVGQETCGMVPNWLGNENNRIQIPGAIFT